MHRELDAFGFGHYKVMPNDELLSGSLRVVAIQPDHIENVRLWRNAQMDSLRQTQPITPEEQLKYFSTHVWPEKPTNAPRRILLAIEEQAKLIGYGGLVYIDWENRRAEVSFLLAGAVEAQPDRRSKVFYDFLNAMKVLAFADLSLNRLFTETFANRARHIQTLETAGFKREGILREHVMINSAFVDSVFHGAIASDEQVKK